MKFTPNSIENFKKIIDSCDGDVFLLSPYGDRYNLKSTLSQYVALGKLIEDKEDLELWATNIDDQVKLLCYFKAYPQVLS